MKGSVSISLVEVYKRVGKSVIAVCETQGLERPDRRIFGREKKNTRKLAGLIVYSYLKDGESTVAKRDVVCFTCM